MKVEVPKRQMRTLARASDEEQAAIVGSMTPADMLSWDADFESWAHKAQLPPRQEGWRTWLMMAGRGFGKTRAGAEWIEKLARSRPNVRIALVGASIDEARRIMVEGVSGVLSVARRNNSKVKWEPSIGRLTWSNGSEAQLFSGDSPDGLRGPEHDFAWALQLLDAVVAGAVEEPPRDEPPASPLSGQCYLVGSSPVGDWSQHAGKLAVFSEAGWRFVAPVAGMSLLVKTSETLATYGSAGWEVGTIRASRLLVEGEQVVGPRSAAISDPAGGSTVDAEARFTLQQVLSALRQHGLIATS